MATLNIGKKIVYSFIPASNVTNTSSYQVYYVNTSRSAVLQVHQFSYSYVSGPTLGATIVEIYDLTTGSTIRTLVGGPVGVINDGASFPLGAPNTDEAFRGHFLLYPNTGIRYRNNDNNAAIHRFGTIILLGEENTQ